MIALAITLWPLLTALITIQSGCIDPVNAVYADRLGTVPAIGTLSTTGGSSEGGTRVVLSGFNYAQNASVKFAATEATILSQTASSIEVLAPPHAPDTVSVSVSNPDGSTVTLPNAFVYAAAAKTNVSAIPMPPPAASGYKLAFSDDFNSLDLSPAGQGFFAWYRGIWLQHKLAPIGNISANASVLSLKWQQNQGTDDTSISTLSPDALRYHAWRYGYFEARMKWDVTRGAWPAFWLIPVEDAAGKAIYNGKRESGEIDIFEGQGSDPHTFYGTWHDWVNGVDVLKKGNAFALPTSVNMGEYHVYGLLWTPGQFTWYLDNVALGTSKNTPAIFDKQNFFIVLGSQEGVNWTYGNRSWVKSGQMNLDVDWVRVWQK
jgi:beta-glucanase (GH16 family)